MKIPTKKWSDMRRKRRMSMKKRGWGSMEQWERDEQWYRFYEEYL